MLDICCQGDARNMPPLQGSRGGGIPAFYTHATPLGFKRLPNEQLKHVQAGEHEQPHLLLVPLPHLPPAGRQVGERECVCLLIPRLKPGAIHH